MKTTILSFVLLTLVKPSYGQITLLGESFSKIKIENRAKVTLRQDSISSVKFSGNDNPANTETTIKNGTLVIDGSPDNELVVSLPLLQQISIDGNGTVTGESTFKTDDLKLAIDGDGKINLTVDAGRIQADVSGLGKIMLSGTAKETDFSIPGSGKIDALGLKTIKSNVNISGFGKCQVDVVDELTTNISGVGTVTYKALPKKLNENITGSGNVNCSEDANLGVFSQPDTTKLEFGKKQIWIIGKKDSTRSKKNKVKPIWAGFELGINSYVESGGSFTLSPGLKNFELRTEKSTSVALNLFQSQVELGKSNIWLLTGLGISWNNYRFENNVVLDNGSVTTAHVDTTPGVRFLKSKLVASYLTAPVMFELFTSRNQKKAFHLGAGAMLGLRIGSHTKQKIEIDGDVKKLKDHDDYNLNPFKYGFRVAVGYGSINVFADYYASTLFKNNKGPVLYPVNVGITLIGF